MDRSFYYYVGILIAEIGALIVDSNNSGGA